MLLVGALGGWVTIWLVCALVTVIIAVSKGRSFFGWLLIGLILGIFGLILAAVLPSLKGTIEYEEPPGFLSSTRRAKMKKCPDCAEQIRADARVCKHCGYRFDAGSRKQDLDLLPVDTSKWSQRDREAYEARLDSGADGDDRGRGQLSRRQR